MPSAQLEKRPLFSVWYSLWETEWEGADRGLPQSWTGQRQVELYKLPLASLDLTSCSLVHHSCERRDGVQRINKLERPQQWLEDFIFLSLKFLKFEIFDIAHRICYICVVICIIIKQTPVNPLPHLRTRTLPVIKDLTPCLIQMIAILNLSHNFLLFFIFSHT